MLLVEEAIQGLKLYAQDSKEFHDSVNSLMYWALIRCRAHSGCECISRDCEHEILDLAQEVCLAVWERRNGIRSVGAYSYFDKICRTVVVDRFRRRGREKRGQHAEHGSLESDESNPGEPGCARDIAGHDQLASASNNLVWLMTDLERLKEAGVISEIELTVVMEALGNGRSRRDIAASMKLSKSETDRIFQRAVQVLRRFLA
jgi:DNA-directed RNA polymerase specialized sigma24 family protein